MPTKRLRFDFGAHQGKRRLRTAKDSLTWRSRFLTGKIPTWKGWITPNLS